MTCTPSTRRLLDGVARVSLVPARHRRVAGSTAWRGCLTGCFARRSTHCRAWQLNERHYGALTGVNKHDARDQYGEAQLRRRP